MSWILNNKDEIQVISSILGIIVAVIFLTNYIKK